MTKKRIIVTGVSGFIGGQTMLYLRDQGHKVIGVDIRPLPEHLRGVPDIFLHEDYSSRYILDMITREGADAIIHCAATSLVAPVCGIQNSTITTISSKPRFSWITSCDMLPAPEL